MARPYIVIAVAGLGPPSPPVNVTPPSISGTDIFVGGEVGGNVGTYSPAATSYQRQWYRDSAGDPIAGATGSDYLFVDDDSGHDVIFGVVPINAGGTGAEAFSDPVGPVASGVPVNVTPPSISATELVVGVTVDGIVGTWHPSAVSYTYKWYQNTTTDVIAGATGHDYVLAGSDAGEDIIFGVTPTNAQGTGAEAFSAATGPILPGLPINTVAPTISGSPQVGQTLSGGVGTWVPAADSYARQWYEDSAGDPIAGASGSTYVAATANDGHNLLFGVKGVNASGTGTEAFSAPFGPIVNFVGLIDMLDTMPVGAWYVARVLKASYLEGPLIRLRRGSDNAESDFGADGSGVLDTAAITTWLGGATGYFRYIYDQIASQHMGQSDTTKQPVYEPNVSAINGRANLDHGGWGNRFFGTLASNWSGNQAHCLVTFGNTEVNNDGSREFFKVGNMTKSTCIGTYGNPLTWWFGGWEGPWSADSRVGTADDNYHSFVKRHNGTNSIFIVDGVELADQALTYALTGTSEVWIGQNGSNNTNSNCRFAEGMAFSTDITDDDAALIPTNQASFY